MPKSSGGKESSDNSTSSAALGKTNKQKLNMIMNYIINHPISHDQLLKMCLTSERKRTIPGAHIVDVVLQSKISSLYSVSVQQGLRCQQTSPFVSCHQTHHGNQSKYTEHLHLQGEMEYLLYKTDQLLTVCKANQHINLLHKKDN